ncbi:unnamed protein product, partial [Symbiodinium sp. KB8]
AMRRATREGFGPRVKAPLQHILVAVAAIVALAGVLLTSWALAAATRCTVSKALVPGAIAAPSASAQAAKSEVRVSGGARPSPAQRSRPSTCVVDAFPAENYGWQPARWHTNKSIEPCLWRAADTLGNDSFGILINPCTFMHAARGHIDTAELMTRKIVMLSSENTRRCWGNTPDFARTILHLAGRWATFDPNEDISVAPPHPSPATWFSFAETRHAPTRARRPTLVAGAVSNCERHLSPRLPYMNELEAWLNASGHGDRVEFRGGCFGREDSIDLGQKVAQKLPMLANSTFAIAMENSAAPGYASEKVMDAIVVGAVPLVWGGTRYSALLPRAAGDADGGHPVFIDLAALSGPAEMSEYMLWLESTGKVDNYRPWTKMPVPDSPGGEGARQWLCTHDDVVRCGFGQLSAFAAVTVAETQIWTTEQFYGRQIRDDELQPWLLEARKALKRYKTAGDAALSKRLGEPASSMAAPWRHPRADPTMAEWRLATGRTPSGLGHTETTLDLAFCRCETGSAWCKGDLTYMQPMSRSRRHYWWLGAFVEDVAAGRSSPMACQPWSAGAGIKA